MRTSGILVAVFSLVFAMIPIDSQAVLLSAGACVGGKTDLGPFSEGCSGTPGGGGSIFTGATGVGGQVTFDAPGGPNFVHLFAAATQDFGISRAQVSISVAETIPGPGEGWNGNTIGEFTDTLTIMPPAAPPAKSLLGKPGSFTLSYTVTGMVTPIVSLPNPSASFAVVAFLNDGTNTIIRVTPPAGPIVNGVFTSSRALPMTFGLPFDLDVQTLLSAGFGHATGDGSPASGNFAADFSATATLTAIQAFDQFGDPVPGIAITAASGTGFPLTPPAEPGPGPGPSVPGPSTLLMMGIGGIAAGVGRMARRRRS